MFALATLANINASFLLVQDYFLAPSQVQTIINNDDNNI